MYNYVLELIVLSLHAPSPKQFTIPYVFIVALKHDSNDLHCTVCIGFGLNSARKQARSESQLISPMSYIQRIIIDIQ